MADEWHVRWLKEGVQSWNRRRRKVAFFPDLSGIRFFDFLPPDFRDSPKTSRYFEKIDLTGANLRNADLSDLNFAKGKFIGADLSFTDLSLSNFDQSDFSDAQLVGVRADHSTFRQAKFQRTVLLDAEFTETDATDALFIQTDLAQSQVLSLSSSRISVFEKVADFLRFKRTSREDLSAEGPARAAKEKPKQSHRYDVYYGTIRTPVLAQSRVVDFNAEFDSAMNYGVCEVAIPEKRQVGTLGSRLWKIFRSPPDSSIRIESITTLNEPLFWESLRQSSDKMSKKERPTLFIHGYCSTFQDAVCRAAQIGIDLGIGQGVFLFSWPSKGAKPAYTLDEVSAERSKYFLADFIEGLVRESPQNSLNIIAHSMGCRCLMNAIEVLDNGRKGILNRINQVILAAADVDSGIMLQQAKYAINRCKRTTVYVCEEDFALKASGFLHGFPRVGFRPPTFVLPGIDTVQVDDNNLGDFSHGYIGTNRHVLGDVHELFKSNTPPQYRFAIAPASENGNNFWKIKP